jgi:hypothetical protein
VKKLFSVIVVLCFGLVACNFPTNMFLKLTPDEKSYLERANAQPLTFMVKPEDSDRLWKMAEAFVEKYASMKIEKVSDVAIETYNPIENHYGYRVIRTPKKDGDEFSIIPLYTMFNVKPAEQNAHIFAHYLLSEEIMERLIER